MAAMPPSQPILRLAPDRRAVLLGLGAALFAPRAQAAAPDTRFFRIGTGPVSGTYFAVGGEIASALSTPPGARSCAQGGSCGVPGLIAVAQATEGSVENAQSIADGTLDSAFCQADVAAWAYEGGGPFDKRHKLTGLRSLANLYVESLHVIVRADSGITDLKGLRGKRVSLAEPQSGTLADARLVLDAAGLAERDVKPANATLVTAAQKLHEGALDAIVQIGGYPVPEIAELASAIDLRLLPIAADAVAKLRKASRFIQPDIIPGGTYRGVAGDVPTVGISAQWIVADTMEADLAYALVGALWHRSTARLLQTGHPAGRRIAAAHALDGLALPLHPGAARWYREGGYPVPDEAAAKPG